MLNQESRVLSRRGARELTSEEAGIITGGFCPKPPCTATLCTFSNGKSFDGDPGECS